MSSSTYEYSQEIFETYKAKVIQLCLEIGYGEPTEVERMKGGSFNRIIGLSFDTPEKKQYILRIPREPYDETQDYEISDQVEVLLYLAQFDSLKVPSILAYDATTNNAIKSHGVLDWDDALSVPPVLAGYQYSWLWCDEEERSPHWAYDRDTNPERPLTADELLVKANFDQIVARACPNFLEDTYGRGVWLRRLARFGIYGFHDSEDFARYTQFVKDWSMYYETLSLGATETDAEV
ncbi:hypothetical protein DL95DRAFT_289579 [Leptodontidium sp. 2 PMI_412]|nr:hypothetical protein DL95DRAFT_289579 [Leptodontidium sp. 2 PMI_412]